MFKKLITLAVIAALFLLATKINYYPSRWMMKRDQVIFGLVIIIGVVMIYLDGRKK